MRLPPMFKMDLDASLYTDERVGLATKFSDPHHRVVSPEETAATYDLIGEIYLKGGWGSRFHFAPQARLERMDTALLRWERFLAQALAAGPGMKLLDVGSGIGGPACDVARMTGARVLGLDVSRVEVEHANRRAKQLGLDHLVEFRVGNFNDLSAFADGSFDGVYSFQTICYSPDKRRTYQEFERVLKPGGRFAEYAWATKPAYDPNNATHVEIVEHLADNVKCQKLEPVEDILRYVRESGLRLGMSLDLTEMDGLDWTRPVRFFNHPVLLRLIRASVRLLPARVWRVHDFLVEGLPYYVAAHRLDIFTPCQMIVAQKNG